jgi:hypothetical protein
VIIGNKESEVQMEKRAVVVDEKEKQAHVEAAEKAGQKPDPNPKEAPSAGKEEKERER